MAKRSKRRRTPRSGGGLGLGMMQQLQQLEAAQEALAQATVTGSAGGGAVKVTLTGEHRCQEVFIDPALLEDADAEMLQDLIMAAHNQAVDALEKLAEERLGPLTSGLGGLLG